MRLKLFFSFCYKTCKIQLQSSIFTVSDMLESKNYFFFTKNRKIETVWCKQISHMVYLFTMIDKLS